MDIADLLQQQQQQQQQQRRQQEEQLQGREASPVKSSPSRLSNLELQGVRQPVYTPSHSNIKESIISTGSCIGSSGRGLDHAIGSAMGTSCTSSSSSSSSSSGGSAFLCSSGSTNQYISNNRGQGRASAPGSCLTAASPNLGALHVGHLAHKDKRAVDSRACWAASPIEASRRDGKGTSSEFQDTEPAEKRGPAPKPSHLQPKFPPLPKPLKRQPLPGLEPDNIVGKPEQSLRPSVPSTVKQASMRR